VNGHIFHWISDHNRTFEKGGTHAEKNPEVQTEKNQKDRPQTVQEIRKETGQKEDGQKETGPENRQAGPPDGRVQIGQDRQGGEAAEETEGRYGRSDDRGAARGHRDALLFPFERCSC
jgi:hypothetical protein